MKECDVNRYVVGSGLCMHTDSDAAMTLLAALPGEGPFSGGFLRVAPLGGLEGVCIREGASSSSSVPLKRARDLEHVPLAAFDVAVFDGNNHFHEVSEVTAGVRYSLGVGFMKCPGQ